MACLKLRGKDDVHAVASEPSSFDLIDAEFVRNVEPGEMVVFTESSVKSMRPFSSVPQSSCIFEYVYFARPDAVLDGIRRGEVKRPRPHRRRES